MSFVDLFFPSFQSSIFDHNFSVFFEIISLFFFPLFSIFFYSVITTSLIFSTKWKTELEKYAKTISVKTIATIRDYKALSYKDIAEADAVILSFQFVQNTNYIFFESGTFGTGNMKVRQKGEKIGKRKRERN